jgi:transcriptional regulator with XRE-family HTH domain
MFAKRLKLARKRMKMTQEELAKRVNTKKTTISNYETGYSTPSNEMLSDIANVLEVSTDFLLGRIDQPDLFVRDSSGNLYAVEVKSGGNNNRNIEKEEKEFLEFIRDPELQVWFKEISQSSEEQVEELRDFWEFIKNRKKKN